MLQFLERGFEFIINKSIMQYIRLNAFLGGAYFDKDFVHYWSDKVFCGSLFYILVPCISMRKDRYQKKLTLFTLSVTINEKDVIMNNL